MRKYGFSFSWKRLLGITGAKQFFARKTCDQKSKTGIERELGSIFLKNYLVNN